MCIYIHPSVCALKFMLPTCKPNVAINCLHDKNVEQAGFMVQSQHLLELFPCFSMQESGRTWCHGGNKGGGYGVHCYPMAR